MRSRLNLPRRSEAESAAPFSTSESAAPHLTPPAALRWNPRHREQVSPAPRDRKIGYFKVPVTSTWSMFMFVPVAAVRLDPAH